jgi:hypothetical protein
VKTRRRSFIRKAQRNRSLPFLSTRDWPGAQNSFARSVMLSYHSLNFGRRTSGADEILLWIAKAGELRSWKVESPDVSPDDFIFLNADGGFLLVTNYHNRVLKPLAQRLGIEKLNFQIRRRTMATQAQNMGSVKGISHPYQCPRERGLRQQPHLCRTCRPLYGTRVETELRQSGEASESLSLYLQ